MMKMFRNMFYAVEDVEDKPNAIPLKTVGEMVNGDKGFTMEWALKRNPSGRLVLNPHFPLYEDMDQNVDLAVIRVNDMWLISEPKQHVPTQSGWTGRFKVSEEEFVPCVINGDYIK